MSIEAKAVLLNRVENQLNDKLTVNATNTAMVVFSDELDAFEVEHVSTDTPEINDDLLKMFLQTKALEGRSKKTLERYEYEIKKFMAHAQVKTKEITIYHLREYLDYERNRGISDETIRGKRDIFVGYFNWLFKESLITKNPVVNLTSIKCQKKFRDSFSDIDIDLMKDACDCIRDKAIITFLLSTGCRVSEVVQLNRTDIDFNTSECTVLGKGNKERKVFLDKSATYYLKRYLHERTDRSLALFVSKDVKRLSANGIRAMLKRIEERSGVENVHPHRFRRTLATRMIARGAPIQIVALILGHDKLDTTMKYIAYTTNKIKDEYFKFL